MASAFQNKEREKGKMGWRERERVSGRMGWRERERKRKSR